MARVPTWTELRLDAIKLANLQNDCYNEIHNSLDNKLPELDRKILSLNADQLLDTTLIPPRRLVPQNIPEFVYDIRPRSPELPFEEFDFVPSYVNIPPSKSSEFDKFMHEPIKTTKPYHSTVIDISYSKKRDKPQPEDDLPVPKPTKHKSNHRNIVRSRTVDENLSNSKTINSNTNGFSKKSLRVQRNNKDFEINRFEHLRPNPMPLNEYLRQNRPEFISRANGRVLYMRKRAEMRKYIASSKIITALEQIRLSAKNSRSSLYGNHVEPSRQPVRDYITPDYNVKCKLSEYEMKRLTARVYKRLPEVKKRRQEEVKNYMKVQNIKNKSEYVRKMFENRKQGIINYPIINYPNYDDGSITSSQDKFSSLNGYNRQSADIDSNLDSY